MEILDEDNHIIVCYKPVGILSQEDESGDIDMLRMIKGYIKEKYNKPGEVYTGLVHRLDRNTDGVMVFAKTSKAASRLSEAIKKHEFNKCYLAVVEGRFKYKNATGVLEDKLSKDERNKKSFVDKNGKPSKLEYTVLDIIKKDNQEYSLIKVKLLTGRHHQIRVQFSSRGFPLYGDIKYGSSNEIGNQYALSCYYLSFIHPTLKELREYFYFKPNHIFKCFYQNDDFLEYYKLK